MRLLQFNFMYAFLFYNKVFKNYVNLSRFNIYLLFMFDIIYEAASRDTYGKDNEDTLFESFLSRYQATAIAIQRSFTSRLVVTRTDSRHTQTVQFNERSVERIRLITSACCLIAS